MGFVLMWRRHWNDRLALVTGLMLTLAIAVCCPSGTQAAQSVVTRITSTEAAAETQVSIVATQPMRYQLRDLRRDWIVVDIAGAELGMPTGQVPPARGVVKKLRVGQFTSDTVRVVVELVQPVDFHLSMLNNNATIVVRIPTAAGARPNATPAQGHSQPTVTHPIESSATPQIQAVQPQPLPAKGSGNALSKIHAVMAGKGIGSTKLGMTIKELLALNGPSRGTERMSDGTTIYRWFEPPANVGLGVRVTPAGTVYRIWTLNDQQYLTTEGLHVGSTEAEVRAALGEPSRVVVNAQTQIKTLTYAPLGVWFGIQLEERFAFYNRVFEIGVMQPK